MSDFTIEKVDFTEVACLRDLSIKTFRETFGFDNTEQQLQEYFEENLTFSIIESELQNPESEYYFLKQNKQAIGILKVNWGAAQTEQELEDAFEIQRIYILQEFQGQGLGKVLFDFAMERANASGKSWAWLGVWEKNTKAQSLYAKYGFEKFAEHTFPVGDKMDTDWLFKKRLK